MSLVRSVKTIITSFIQEMGVANKVIILGERLLLHANSATSTVHVLTTNLVVKNIDKWNPTTFVRYIATGRHKKQF